MTVERVGGRRRWLVPVVAVLVAALVYATVVLLYAGGLRESSNGCVVVVKGDERLNGDDLVKVELQPAAVNAANQRIQFQLTLKLPDRLLSPDGYTANQTVNLLTFPVDGSSVLTFPEGEALGSSTQSDYAEGIVEEWPFDSYRAHLTTLAYTGEGDERVGVPTEVCLDDTVPGWQLNTQTKPSDNSVTTASGEQALPTVEITATRSASTVAFGIVLLGLMAATPVLVLFVAISAYTGRRRVEATLTSWIGAMLFAVIPLRNFLPGSPPVGSWIDYLVVLWVIVGLVTGLTIYVLAWNRWGTCASPRGPEPREPAPPDPSPSNPPHAV
ncbi:DUF4436 family protein [Subtercola boreus]|uniref:DUF4436 domain-containing protein n=1 Tax=Subtercola boreus TaxID=120213 RepID=A0A3E0W6I5_9MICO|nr:DUF4436 family protein [Subtercola boreus]RFA18124.1 hypothetical protein B7R24_15880 [Subtercola boreus]RFA18506.1 hypothetical protein B7R23_15915 [Subtercola boreus]RFA25034.1 hypothetical protein B7R25_15910 [Subtercola boreus]